MILLTKMSKGYQITIPAKIRKKLGLDKGSLIDLELDEEKENLTLKAVKEPDLEEVFKNADKLPRHKLTPKKLKEMDSEIYG